MIRLEQLKVEKQSTLILKNINLTVNKGDKILLKGESGSGKSTLIKAMLLFEQFKGELFYNNDAITKDNLWQYRRQSIYISQTLPDLDDKVRDFLRIPYTFKFNKSLTFNKDKMHELLEKLNFSPDVVEKNFSELSGGEKQRMVILQMLLLDKPIYFLDEVTSALDKKNIQAAVSLITEKKEKTIISISHNQEWEDYCTRIIGMEKGSIIKDYNKGEN